MKADFYLLLATFLWGIWGFADKMAVTRAHPYTVQWVYSIPYILFIPVWYVMSRKAAGGASLDPQAAAWTILASVASMAAMLFLFFALRSKPASIAMAMTAAYPLVTHGLAVIMKMEQLSAVKVGGMLLIILGVVLLWD